MKITQHSNTLWQMTKMAAFNCYLLEEEDGLTLIDTGLPNSADDILAAAQDIGKPIVRVLLTHAHTDHVGSLDDLRQALPAAVFGFSPRTESFLNEEPTLLPDEPQTPIKGGFITSAIKADLYLKPGDRVGSLQVIAAPGHAPDHMAFLDTRDHTLIAGDAFQTAAGVAVAGTLKLLFPFPAMATWHKPTALATAQELLALRPTRLAVGHGPVLESPQEAMAAAIRKAGGSVRQPAANGA